MTKSLQPFYDYMFDLHPVKQPKPVLNKNWNEFEKYAGAIMGDGIINLEGFQLVEKLLTKCNKLVCRVFLKKFSWMKYATHFPQEFPNAKMVIPTQEGIAMVVWEN